MDNIAFIEKRKEERIAPKDNTMFVRLPLTFPLGKELFKPICDISSSGLSFKMDKDEGYFLPGSPLKNIVIKNTEYEKTISNSIVRNCVTIDTNNTAFNRIGIEFLLKPFEKSIIRRKLLSHYKLRMPRYSGDLTPLLNWKISFPHKGQKFKSSTILNFSKFGIAFCIESPALSINKSDVLLDFKIIIDDESIYEGECLVANLQNTPEGLVVGGSLKRGNIDLEKISFLSKISKAAEEINTSLHKFSKIDDIDHKFKSDLADLRYFLEKLESKLDIEDQIINNSEAKEEYISNYKEKLLISIHKSVFKQFDRFFNSLKTTVSNFHELKYDLYKYHFRENVLQYFLKSPFVNRSHNKPLGYAGDYEVMNMLYMNPYAGESLFGKLINKYSWEQTAAKAVRNRISYLTSKFYSLLDSPIKRDNNYARIMSVGSGPAVEIQEIIKREQYSDKLVFTLIEADTEALLYSQDKLLNIIKDNEKIPNINFVNKAVDQLIKDKSLVDRLEKQDLIYSVGLYDYLSIAIIKKLTKCLYDLLNDNGILIIGNFNHLNDTKIYMEYVNDWYLFYRSEEEMLKFIEKIPAPKKVYFETDDTKITNFMIINK